MTPLPLSRRGKFQRRSAPALYSSFYDTVLVLYISKSDRTFGAAMFHHIESQPSPLLPNPPYLYHNKKIVINRMDDMQGVNEDYLFILLMDIYLVVVLVSWSIVELDVGEGRLAIAW